MGGMLPRKAVSYGSVLPRAAAVVSQAERSQLSKAASGRLKWFDFYRLHENARQTCRHFAISPSTFYKWQARYDPKNLSTLNDESRKPLRGRTPRTPAKIVDRVLELRQQNPRWGKAKLAVLLKREGISLGASTVGRILKRLRERGRLVEPENVRQAKLARKRRRKPRYAIRKPREFRARQPGDLVEVDTLHVRICPNTIRIQFGAVDVVSRVLAVRAFRRSTSSAGAAFLHYLRKKFPYPIRAIQIDGGSEFMELFEEACRQSGLPVYVNPPRCPELNGHIERANRTVREEFYEVEDLELSVEGLNRQLDRYAYNYNHIRPHQALGLITPMEYVRGWKRSQKG